MEQEASFPLRTVSQRFLTHGSYHILSNRYALAGLQNLPLFQKSLRGLRRRKSEILG